MKMDKKVFDEIQPKFKEYIIFLIEFSNLYNHQEMPVETLKERIEMNLMHQEYSLRQKIEKQEGREKETYKTRLQEISLMRQMFQINPEATIKECNEELAKRKQNDDLRHFISRDKSIFTQELLEGLKNNGKKDYSIPELDDDEQSL